MRKLVNTQIVYAIFGMFFSTTLIANNLKVPMHVSLVPTHISEEFYNSHSEIEEHFWYPYPYIHETSEMENQRYFSKLTHADESAFFEVEFKENGSIYRKIFDENGEVQIWSEIVKDFTLSQQIKNELSAMNYFDWKIENYEKVYQNNFESEIKHKVILSKESKTRVIYFNENEFVHKVLKWELQNYNFSKHKTVFLRAAFQGNRTEIKATELPDSIKSVILEKQLLTNVEKILMVDAVHIPEHRIILEYYDIPLKPKYEVLYKKGSHHIKAIFSSEGELLEENKVIELKKLPKYVKAEMDKQKYTFWRFDNLADIVYLEDGSSCYRLHAQEFGISQLLVLNSK